MLGRPNGSMQQAVARIEPSTRTGMAGSVRGFQLSLVPLQLCSRSSAALAPIRSARGSPPKKGPPESVVVSPRRRARHSCLKYRSMLVCTLAVEEMSSYVARSSAPPGLRNARSLVKLRRA
jgi:hypothetical protein